VAKKDPPEIEEPSAPFWLTTFSDMVTLLMVFFILILSFSTIELEKFKGAMSSMKGALGIMPEMSINIGFPQRRIRRYNFKIKKLRSKNILYRRHTSIY